MKRIVTVLTAASFLVPVMAFAQGGPFFNDDNNSGYGGTVTVCYRNETRTVSAREARRLIERGATPGACVPDGALTITKTAVNGDDTFRFTIDGARGNRNVTITTRGGTGSQTITLPRGTYSVSERRDNDWVQTSNTCANITITSGATSTCEVTNTIKLASISGAVVLDVNGNGRLNFFERFWNRQSGVTVYLDSNNNAALDTGEPTQVTDSNGNYRFSALVPNKQYVVREVVPSGFTQTFPGSKRYIENLEPGDNETGDVFANYKPGLPRHWWDL